MGVYDSNNPLTFRTEIKDPVTIAKVSMYGLTVIFGLQAMVFPQYKETDFLLYLYTLAGFVAFSFGYIVWLRFFCPKLARGTSFPIDPPPVDALVPVPIKPKPPVLKVGAARALPIKPSGPLELKPSTI